jgi:quercetin dioxygenase-like cupin family protein
MTKGWFVGDFEPTLLRTTEVEVAVKHYRAGDREEAHFHRIATELTVVVNGKVRMGESLFKAGDIIVVQPGESTDFEAVTDAITAVVKIPGAKHDKYLVSHAAT